MSKRFTRHPDGAVHFSLLKKMALSPLHYAEACRAACLEQNEPTRQMRVGTGAHFQLLGPRDGHRIVAFEGDTRTGAVWKSFAAEHEGAEILTAPEWADATAIAEAVRRDPIAAPLLEGRHEVPLRWDDGGITCATEGVDIVGKGRLVDLKTTPSTEPEKWKRHAFGMHYPAQLMFYAEGARQNGIDVHEGLYLIGVESCPPYAVTVLKLTPATEDHGRRCVALWLEQLRRCEENDFWPGYTQQVVDFDLPPWMVAVDDDSEAA